jgi:hypothetical protein
MAIEREGGWRCGQYSVELVPALRVCTLTGVIDDHGRDIK